MLQYAGGNRLTLLRNGEQYFPALVRALDAARREVFLETYIAFLGLGDPSTVSWGKLIENSCLGNAVPFCTVDFSVWVFRSHVTDSSRLISSSAGSVWSIPLVWACEATAMVANINVVVSAVLFGLALLFFALGLVSLLR